MNLTQAQLKDLSQILEGLEEGRRDPPRATGPIGQFLREFAQASADAETRLGVTASKGGSVSGTDLMPVELAPISPLELSLRGPLIGSVTSAIVVNETFGMTMRSTLWGGTSGAERLLRLWRNSPNSIACLEGSYRWHLPERITPGAAHLDSATESLHWWEARCLKYSGDGVGRPPKAASFHPDWLIGPPGIKAFRVFAIQRNSNGWEVFPTLGGSAAIEVIVPSAIEQRSSNRCLALAWTQPWEPERWTVFEARNASDDEVLGHNITWADHIRELEGHGPLTDAQLWALQDRAHDAGATGCSAESALRFASMTRKLDPQMQRYAAWLRGEHVSYSTGQSHAVE